MSSGSFARDIFLHLFKGAGELILPGLCPLCKQAPPVSEGFGFCKDCFSALSPVSDPKCTICGLPYSGAGDSHPCSRCIKHPPSFVALRAWGAYEGTLLKAIRSFKYGKGRALRAVLEALALDIYEREYLKQGFYPAAVVPVPTDLKTLRRRGFDLPSLISRKLAKTINVPWRPYALQKTIDAPDLIGLDVAARARAAAKAYAPNEPLHGAILLVDDVVTTTATSRACARACFKAGADGVYALALARTKFRH